MSGFDPHEHIATFSHMDLSGIDRDKWDLWLTDLETTTEPQTNGYLTTAGGDCCMGRMCKVAIEDGVGVNVVHPDDMFAADGDYTLYDAVRYDDEECFPPLSVCEWLGLDYDPDHDGESAFTNECAALNDGAHLTFPQIAAVLRVVFDS